MSPASNARTVNLTQFSDLQATDSSIGHGDLLELTISTGYETHGSGTILARVDERGSINVPLIGLVQVAGLEPAEAEQRIAGLAVDRQIYRQPYITLAVKRPYTNKVTVVGAVENPGVYELPRGSSDLLGALASAGGLNDEAGTDVDILRRGSRLTGDGDLSPVEGLEKLANAAGVPEKMAEIQVSYTAAKLLPSQSVSTRVNLDKVSQATNDEYQLGDGDVVMVFPQQPRVIHVMGLVRKPNQFEIPPNQDVHLLDALALAGGRRMQVADKVRVIRRIPGQKRPIIIHASVKQAKKSGEANLRLAPGDLVSVDSTPTTVVIDTVKSFMRFGLSAGVPLF